MQGALDGKESQFQIDLPDIRPRTTEFVLHYGECTVCGQRAMGATLADFAGSGSGRRSDRSRVVSLATYLNKTGGLSYGKIGALLEQLMGLRVLARPCAGR